MFRFRIQIPPPHPLDPTTSMVTVRGAVVTTTRQPFETLFRIFLRTEHLNCTTASSPNRSQYDRTLESDKSNTEAPTLVTPNPETIDIGPSA